MTDALSIEERQAAMVQRELDAGRWISTQDSRGRTVYYNPTTKETTRDLRVHLLRQTGWEMLSSRNKEAKEREERKKRDIEIQSPEEQLRQELADARVLIEAYEAEVTWLRLALLEAEKKLDPGELAVAESSRLSRFSQRKIGSNSNSSSTAAAKVSQINNAATSTAATSAEQSRSGSAGVSASAALSQARARSASNVGSPSSRSATAAAATTVVSEKQRSSSPTAARGSLDDDDATVLRAKLAESRRLNQRLLNRVALDRQQKHLCTRCLQDVERVGGAGATSLDPASSSSMLASGSSLYSLTVPGGVGFPSTLSNPQSYDAVMLARGLEHAHISHPAVTAAQLGFLPRGYDPMRGSNQPNAWESPAKRALSPNRQREALHRPQQQQRSPPRATTGGYLSHQSHNNNNNSDYDQSQLTHNLHALQLLRSSLEGDFPRDAHVRDADRNDFFRSPYFTASIKHKTAGSKSTDLSNANALQAQQQHAIQHHQAMQNASNQRGMTQQQQQQQQQQLSTQSISVANNNNNSNSINNSSGFLNSSGGEAAAAASGAKRKLSSGVPGSLYSGHLYGNSWLM